MSTNSTANDEDRDPGTRSEAGLPVVRLIRTARGGIGAAWRGRHRPKRGGPGMWSGLVLTMLSVVLLATPPARAQQCAPPTVSVERLGGELIAPRSPGTTFRFARTGDTADELQFEYRLTSNGLNAQLFRSGASSLPRNDEVHSVAFPVGDQYFDLNLFALRPDGDTSTDDLELTVEIVGGEGSPCLLYSISQTASEASVLVEPYARVVSVKAYPSSIFYEELVSSIEVTLDKPAIYDYILEIEGLDQSSRPELTVGSGRTGSDTLAGIARDYRDLPIAFFVPKGEQSAYFQLVYDDEDDPILQGREEVDIQLTRRFLPGPSHGITIEIRDHPPALASVEIEQSSLMEGGRATVTVTLDRPAFSYENLSLSYEEDPYEETGRGALRTEGLGPSGEIVLPPGGRSASFDVVAPDDDNLVQDPETRTIRIKIRNEEDDYFDDRIKKRIEIRDPPPMLDSIKIEPSSIMEGGRATVTVTLDRPAPEDLYLPYDETIDAETDRGALETEGLNPSGELVVPQGDRSASFDVVAPDDDNLIQDPETRTIRITQHNDEGLVGYVEIRDPFPMVASIEIEPSSIMEGGRATVTVTLDRPAPEDLYLSYDEVFGGAQTGRGAIKPELDPSGELVVPQGDRSVSFDVVAPDVDNILQGPETRTIRITNRNDGQSIEVTIEISDSLEGIEALRNRVASEWLPRFGRTVAGIVTETIGGRSVHRGPRRDRVVIGGRQVTRPAANPAAAASVTDDNARSGSVDGSGRMETAWGPEAAGASHRLADRAAEFSGEDVLRGSSLALSQGDGGSDHGWTLWGEWAQAGFDGLNGDGNLSIDGKVASGAFGLELAGENWLTGLALFHGLGEGGYEDRALGGTVYDEVGAWLTSGHPYLRWNPDEATTLWGTLGLGWGKMTVSDPTGDNEADIAMAMGAFGGNRQLLSRGGLDLAVKSDAFWSRITSEETEALAAEDGDVYRIRVGLEGRGHEELLENGARLRPSLEVGMRYDGGDVETGTGLEVGGGIGYVDPRFGLTAEVSGRVLLLHSDSAYEEWGVAGLFRLDPGSDGRGLSLALEPSWGAAPGGADRLGQDGALVSLASEREVAGRVALKLGYGMSALAGAGLLTPHASMTLTDDGARRFGTGLDLRIDPNFSLGLESTHRLDTDNDNAVWLRGRMQW